MKAGLYVILLMNALLVKMCAPFINPIVGSRRAWVFHADPLLNTLSPHHGSDSQSKGFNMFPSLPDWLNEKCKELGYVYPTEVQSRVLPVSQIVDIQISFGDDYSLNLAVRKDGK